jgi:hypothetical protein
MPTKIDHDESELLDAFEQGLALLALSIFAVSQVWPPL